MLKLKTRNVVNAKIKMLEVSSPVSFFDGGVRGRSARHSSGCSSAQCRQQQPSGQRSSAAAAAQQPGVGAVGSGGCRRVRGIRSRTRIRRWAVRVAVGVRLPAHPQPIGWCWLGRFGFFFVLWAPVSASERPA